MNAGQLFVLFGMKVQDDTFKAALKHLIALKVAASAVVGIVRGIGESLTELAMESAKAGTHIIGTAQALGMSTRAVQEWTYVAKQAGSDVEQFTVGISMFERNLREFAAGRGSHRFRDAMTDVHISVGEAKAALAGPDGVNAALFKVSDAYHTMGNTANRAAINTGLFGARAKGMAQDLGQGSPFLRQKIREVHELGGVLDDASLQRLKTFDNSISRIKTSLNGLAMQVVADLAPKFVALIEAITKWIAENRVLISDVLSAAFKVLGFAFQYLFTIVKALGWLIHGVMEGDTGAIILFSILTALVVGLAIAIISLAIPAIAAMGIALWTAFLPVLPFAVALAVIIALSILIYKHWGQISEFFHGFWPWLKGEYDAAIAALGRFAQAIVDVAGDPLAKFKDFAGKGLEYIIEKAIAATNALIHAANYAKNLTITGRLIPDIGDVTMPDWAKHNTGKPDAKAGSPGSGPTPAANGPAVNSGPATGQGARSGPGVAANSISIAPTTVNIYGVKDAKEASEHIADTIDQKNRHAYSALGGEIS